jgi:uncharacterized protein
VNCPVCNVSMIVVEHEGVELDYCVACRGVWFDRDELEYLLGTIHINADDLHIKAAARAAVPAGEKPRRCPRCRKKMAKLAIGGDRPIIVDRCARHGGYWFDGGELPGVIRRSAKNEEWKNVAGFLGNLFISEDKKEGAS